MKKKVYIRPEIECIILSRRPQLLAGSSVPNVSTMSIDGAPVNIIGDDNTGLFGN